MLIGMLLPDGRSIRWLGLLLLLLLLAASTWKKYRHAPWRIRLINAGLFYVYYLGRTASLLHVLSKRFQPAPT
jgi:general stress protein CsbA